MKPEIQIIDVIAKKSPYSDNFFYYVVVNRKPEIVYERHGNKLVAKDSCFYDFLEIQPGTRGAFAGREFDIKLADGSIFHCDGQVWAACHPDLIDEPAIQVGCATMEDLRKCYCFSGAYISKAKLAAWLEVNQPTDNYYIYDQRNTMEWLDDFQVRYGSHQPVCAKRARTLRKRGVTIRVDPATGRKSWSPYYEKRKTQIIAMQAANAMRFASTLTKE